MRRKVSTRQLIYSQLLELDRLGSLADIDKLHFDFQLYKLHSLRTMIHHKHCSTCELIDCIIVLVDNRYCTHTAHFDIRPSYCMDRRCKVRSGIDIWQCDCLKRKLRADHSVHLHTLIDIPSFHFVHSFYTFHFQSIQRLLNIGSFVLAGSHFDLLDCHNIQANIDIHCKLEADC